MDVTETAELTLMADSIRAAMPELDQGDRRIALAAYRRLARGRPATVAELSEDSGVPAAAVEAALGGWPGVYRDSDGRLAGFWGLAVAPLKPEYRLTVGRRTCYAWCALDTLFIPTFMGGEVSVESACAVSGKRVSFRLVDGALHDPTPAGAAVSMAVPDRSFGHDVIETFCHRVLFFASSALGAEWTATHAGTRVISLAEAFQLGRRLAEALLPADISQTEGVEASAI